MDALKSRWLAVPLTIGVVLVSPKGFAGPPYVTDDPEPVEFHHWEFYLASQTLHDDEGWTGTAPHFEVNYGVVPNVQLHLIAPLAYFAPPEGSAHYGYGDTELGVKFRFVQEGKWVPQIGTFPFLEVPTGSRRLGLGNGSAQVFVPIWIQKSFGPWTTYGGAGFWIDAGQPDEHWWYFGWLVQREIIEGFAVGAEVFDFTPKEKGDENDARFNVGAVIDLTDTHLLLFSAGRGFVGPNLFQAYVAYQVTLGPSSEEQ